MLPPLLLLLRGRRLQHHGAARIWGARTASPGRRRTLQVGDVSIRVVDLMDHVLSTYDRAIGAYTAETFKRQNIELVLESRVARVSADSVVVVNKAGEVRLAGTPPAGLREGRG